MSERVCVIFAREAPARFLSHLDLMATLEYAVRRARLPVELSQGFTPRPRLSLAAPLPLGYLGEREILDLSLHQPVPLDELARRLQAVLPAGLVVIAAEQSVLEGSTAARVTGAVYRIELHEAVPELDTRIAALLAEETLPTEEVRSDGLRYRDLRPLLRQLCATSDRIRHLEVELSARGTVRPEQILDLLEIPRGQARIVRERLHLREG